MAVVNIKTYQLEQDCRLPSECPEEIVTDFQAVQLRPEEEKMLLKQGVWLKDTPTTNWAKQTPDGAVWAGNLLNKGHFVAKVRARDGRRMGGGNKPKAVKRVPTSITLFPDEKKQLEALAKKAAKATGGTVSGSMIVSELIALGDDVLPQLIARLKQQAAERKK